MCPSTDEWISKMWRIDIQRNINSDLNKKGILTFLITWINLEGIMLSEIRQRKTNTI